MAMKFKEIEFKYRADQIRLTDFDQFCKDRRPERYLHASGFDHFFAHKDVPGSFCRHRVGPDSNQLSFKRKTEDTNNYVRTEHNLNLADGMTEEQVRALCSEFGYAYTTSIFKNCFIYKYDTYTLVYYICYSLDMVELGRFVEIEMSEEHAWDSEKHAWADLQALERLCGRGLGISKDKRVSESLFELYGQVPNAA